MTEKERERGRGRKRGQHSNPPESEPAAASAPEPRAGLRLLEMAGLVAGYSLAALLGRAILPGRDLSQWGPSVLALITLEYLWLGLALSGPLVLAARRRIAGWTWAESAWMAIGGYWFAIAAFVGPMRLPHTPWLGVFPILAAFAFRLLGRGSPPLGRSWTHPAAVVLIATWPLAWLALIALGQALF